MTDPMPSALEEELLGIKHLLWGNDIKSDIFSRWAQAFYFSKTERTALEQTQGGPCSIIAPVQAFILKNLLLECDKFEFKTNITDEKQNELLLTALCQVLHQCTSNTYLIASLNLDLKQDSSATIKGDGSISDTNNVLTSAMDTQDNTISDQDLFHKNIQLRLFHNCEDVDSYMLEHIEVFKQKFGILLFLYSVIATKGLEEVKSESDTIEPLIDDIYGYGSQSLINLMITGRAVTYVWDFEQDVGGLKLRGLDRQSEIGFITLMEHLRYCTVGTFFKNPNHPVWVLGSETHLTVLFSEDKKLVSPETKSEQARRVFKNYDKDGNNFINADSLQEVLSDLDLVSDEEYVNIMRKKIDSENLGIVLLNAFMDEFFPTEESSTPDSFQVVHYNGLAQSNEGGQIKYRLGFAVLLESDLRAVCESNPMLTCLQTKWPTIELNWENNMTPSLN